MLIKECALAIFFITLSGIAYGAAEQPVADTSDKNIFTACGMKINPKNLHTIASHEKYQMPGEEKEKLNKWLEIPENKEVVDELRRFNFETLNQLRWKNTADNTKLKSIGSENESKYNYVFCPEGSDDFFKASGPINRLWSSLRVQGIWPGNQPTQDQLKKALSGETKTYGTASRFARWLATKNAIEKLDVERHIGCSNTYLLYSDDTEGTNPNHSNDPNDFKVLVVQKKLPSSAKKMNDNDLKKVPDDVLESLLNVTVSVGLWNLKGNLFYDETAKKMYITDFEEPNNFHSEEESFFEANWRTDGNRKCGVEQIVKMLEGSREKLASVRALVDTHPIIQSPAYHAGYKKELDDLLEEKAPAICPSVTQE